MAMLSSIEEALGALKRAAAVFVMAGAGMGCDSGLPAFRTPDGFWKAYPPFAARGLEFHEVSTPKWFDEDPTMAWGFFGHRHQLYTAAEPHSGYHRLLELISAKEPIGVTNGGEDDDGGDVPPGFVFTSNVDGAFVKAGYPPQAIVECHGSLGHLQCVAPCSDAIWTAPDGLSIVVDEDTFRAAEPLPACGACGGLARPNVLMFGDWRWVADRTEAQEERYAQFRTHVRAHLRMNPSATVAIVEMGAGKAVPTVRLESEELARDFGARAALIRINPAEADIPDIGLARGIELAMGAKAAFDAFEAVERS
ncbi:silent information regulator protein Sir2 [Thecamonas trahens ATCC 50062]|uniref:Silent information regulator protein Sir2 n=1 Tax=Thecamonas trahens ATCC 50062 TaxID=461836 RepID=A0A0L0D330_THETB|nr:silent information regulator protein Sir2 [Thecamonas trahens ATCC 50062]KNC46576.1 silent information regulator protein Sir2 [Thecamonas trahens ATCC 50062]|eukprot:XP_013760353.1 silent information regulator protein Sir2 [Thecamonas trahens ATCC 50062]